MLAPVSARGGGRLLRSRHDGAFAGSRHRRGGGDDPCGVAAGGEIGQDLGAQDLGFDTPGHGIGGIDLDAEPGGLRADLRNFRRLGADGFDGGRRFRLRGATAGSAVCSGRVLAAGATAGGSWSSGVVVIRRPFPLGVDMRVDVPHGAAANARRR